MDDDEYMGPPREVEILCSRLLLTSKANNPDAYALVMTEIMNACDFCKVEVLNTLVSTLNTVNDRYEAASARRKMTPPRWVQVLESRLYDLLMGSDAAR